MILIVVMRLISVICMQLEQVFRPKKLLILATILVF